MREQLLAGIGRRHAARGARDSRTPICSSKRRMAWLNPDVEMFNCFAARVKLRSSATVKNAESRLNSFCMIVYRQSTHSADCMLHGPPDC